MKVAFVGEGSRMPLDSTDQPVVLFVEDDPDLLRALLRITKDWPYRVESAGCMRDALYAFWRAPPKVTITDFRLGDGDAAKLIEAAREIGVTSRFVVLSGVAQAPDAFELAKLGASHFLTKPVSPLRLREVVDEVLAMDSADTSAQVQALLGTGSNLKESVEGLRRQMIMDALIEAEGNRSVAAEKLGITRQAVQRAVVKYGLEALEDTDNT